MALNKGIWDPEPRGTNIKGTNLKSLSFVVLGLGLSVWVFCKDCIYGNRGHKGYMAFVLLEKLGSFLEASTTEKRRSSSGSPTCRKIQISILLLLTNTTIPNIILILLLSYYYS